MKVVIINLKNKDSENKTERIKRIENIINDNSGADLYMLPELWNTGFFAFDKNAENDGGETVLALSSLSKKHNAYIFGSIVERNADKLYNTAFLFDRNGNICAKYAKRHLFNKEKDYLSCGDNICVCDTEFGKIGFSICYDLRFPEHFREMIDKGAEIFLNCSAWPKSRLEHFMLLNRTRALENQVISLSCCMSGTDNGNEYAGVAYAVSPKGEIICESFDEVTSISLDLSQIKEYRDSFPVLEDRKK